MLTAVGLRPAKSRMRRIFSVAALGFAGLCVLYAWIFAAWPRSHIVSRAALEARVERPRVSRAFPDLEPTGGAVVPQISIGAAEPQSTDDTETERIQQYLDSRYKRSDVVSSFRTKFDEDIDCIDFYTQPSVKALLARGQQVHIPDISALPTSLAASSSGPPSPLSDVAFSGQPDQDGNPRQCFGMTVPVIRKTVAEIKAAGGLKTYLKRRRHPVPLPPAPMNGNGSADTPGFMHVVASYVGSEQSLGPIYGGGTTVSLWEPTNIATNGHSLAQTWTTSNGTLCTGNGSGSNCVQTVEIGWTVEPTTFATFMNNTFVPDPSPHLFVFSTQDGDWSTGCYDGDACNTVTACDGEGQLPPCNGYTNLMVPNPIVLNPATPWTPGMKLSTAMPGQTAPEIKFATWFLGGEWTVLAGVQGENGGMSEIGFWPPDTWNGGAFECTGGGAGGVGGTCCPPNGSCTANGLLPQGLTINSAAPMATSADIFQVGGEVASSGVPFDFQNPSTAEMGSGIGAGEGYPFAAYHRNILLFTGPVVEGVPETVAGNGIGPWRKFWSVVATDMNCYSVGYGLNGVPQTISLKTSDLGYRFLQYPSSSNPTSYVSHAPGVAGSGANGWGNYMYYGGLGFASGWPFSSLDPDGGTTDFCCSQAAQNGVGDDLQCVQDPG
jgi:hypothetical protein